MLTALWTPQRQCMVSDPGSNYAYYWHAVLPAASTSRITGDQFTRAREILKEFPHKWREIGSGLGFTFSELEVVQNRPLLLATAPLSWLDAMLASWQHWTPTDSRRSRQYPTLCSLRTAVSKAGLGQTAEQLDKLSWTTCSLVPVLNN
jgi:hypothetical protein